MLGLRKENPPFPALCCRIWKNGDVGIAFFSLPLLNSAPQHQIWGCLVCAGSLFSLWAVAAQDVRRKSRAPADRPDVWYGTFFFVLEQKRPKIFSTHTHSWVQGRKEFVVQFHRHSREEWSRFSWQLQGKCDADPHQTGLVDPQLCRREAPKAPKQPLHFQICFNISIAFGHYQLDHFLHTLRHLYSFHWVHSKLWEALAEDLSWLPNPSQECPWLCGRAFQGRMHPSFPPCALGMCLCTSSASPIPSHPSSLQHRPGWMIK